MKNTMWEMSQDESDTTKEHVPAPYRASSPKKDWLERFFDLLRYIMEVCMFATLYIILTGVVSYLIEQKIIKLKWDWFQYVLGIGMGGMYWYMAQIFKKLR